MNYPGYFYDRRYITQYSFVSKGAKGAVTKLVQFSPTNTKNVLNLSFGDMLPNGGIDDKANTNNNDIIKVIATVIEITNDFTMEYPNIKIVFAGSNPTRTSLYQRILKMYYNKFNENFIITALIKQGSGFSEVSFEPYGTNKYLAFFLKRK